MQLTTREAERIFTKLKIVEKRSTHHVAGFLVVDGVKVLPFHYSHGKKDMPANIPHKFRRMMHLSEEEFEKMKVCTMTRDEYIEILADKGLIKSRVMS